MDFSQVAAQLWPMWALGAIMLCLVWKSEYKNQLKVSKKGLINFSKWMLGITILRMVLIKFLAPHEMLDQIQSTVNFIPWQATLGVFWEDACHTMPLVLMEKMFKLKSWYRWASTPLLAMVMFSFGSGHMYQGVMASIMLSFYIPFTMKLAKKYGFGTVMVCHILYDLATLLSMKWLVGA